MRIKHNDELHCDKLSATNYDEMKANRSNMFMGGRADLWKQLIAKFLFDPMISNLTTEQPTTYFL